MCKKLLFLVLALVFCLTSSAYAATIIWVSDNKTPTAGVPADQGWVDLLVAEGYTVDLSFRNAEGRTLDAAKIAALNTADLIIISRDTDSGNYDDGDEPTQWNSITTPIIMQIAQIARSNRWLWLNTTGTNDSLPPAMAAVELGHPVFNGVTLDANKQVSVLTEASSFANTTDPGNGILIAKRADNDQVWIVEWQKGQAFYAGSSQTAAGRRMLFASGTDSGVDGRYNLTAEGKKLFINAVRYMLGELATNPGQASNPEPANEATDVPQDVVLGWTPGEFAPPVNGHKVYLSENFNDVNDGVGGIAVDANSYSPAQRLNFGTTYYWRVDEVNGPPDYTVYQGDVWSFTTEPVAYAIKNVTATASSSHNTDMGPEKTINGSGLGADDLHSKEPMDMWLSSSEPLVAWIEFQFDKVYELHQMWVWNSNQMVESVVGFGFKEVTIEYSTNGADYTTLGTTVEFARAPGTDGYAHNTTVDFVGVAAKYVRLTANSNWGGLPQYGLSEVRFFYIPVCARKPNPDSGATNVDVDVVLNWVAGREAAKHDVYLSTDQQAVIYGTVPVTTVTEASYGPLSLDLGMTYYWKINEVNMVETPATWEGDLWSFTTRQFLVVDDFESYNDLDTTDPQSNRIFNTWIDGYGVPTNGSIVGYENPPFCEQSIIHSGKQSMPLAYSNTGGAAYSEAERTFAVGQNWTKAGSQTLVLFFYGTAGNTGQLYVKINGSKVVYGGDAGDIAKVQWQQWNIALPSLGVNLQNVTKLSIGIDGNGASGKLYFDDIRLYRLVP